MVLKTMINPKN